MSLYYTIPDSPNSPFVAGQMVEVCNRDLETMSVVKVKRAGPRTVTLADGRRFRATDGYWLDERNVGYPFPSIRHAKGDAK